MEIGRRKHVDLYTRGLVYMYTRLHGFRLRGYDMIRVHLTLMTP